MPWLSSYRSTSRRWPAAPCARSSSRKIAEDSFWLTCTSVMSVSTGTRRENMLRSIPITGVMPEPAVTSSSLRGHRGRQDELALGLLQLEHLAGLGAVHEVVGDDTARDRLDGEAQVAVAARAVGQGVGAPEPDAVDVDPDPDVLARARGRPSRDPA